MSSVPIWLTPPGDLGIIPEQEYYEFNFDAYNSTGGALTYSLIAGALPRGLEIKNTGLMIGIPSGEIEGVPLYVNKVTTSTFTIRISNSVDEVSDRTFSLTVAGILPQIITPTSTNLGSYADGTYVEIDINTIEPNPLLRSTFSIISGQLPDGLSLNPITGIISGYLVPIKTDQSASNTDFDKAPWDLYGFDFSGVDTSRNFQFVVEADNGVTIDTKTYTIYVVAVSTLTADNTLLHADDVSLITADIAGPYHLPVITTEEGLIATLRQNTRADIQIVGVDFDGDEISYEISDPNDLPTGLALDSDSGWITGIVPFGTLGNSTYSFDIRVYKTASPDYISAWKTFTIKVVGQIADTVNWLTPSILGSLDTGEISELYIAATTASGRSLSYQLVDSAGRLPIGLKLTETGLLSGRVSFETFMLDSGTTTIDNGTTTFDQVYTFTVAAYDIGNFVYDTKEFTISVVKADSRPYENLYITAYPDRSQRTIYDNIINNGDIFPQDYIYRADDPWFGKNILRRSLFMSGLSPEQASDYIAAMTYNHYWKTLNFGEIKTAQSLDSNFNVTYEVVYVELLDRQVNSSGQSPNLSIGLPSNSRNISTIYPNSFPNMVTRIADNIGYENRGILPGWMTSRQTDGTVLGFTRALVLCYTKPGKSAEIAYRVRQVQDSLKLIDFTIDRYEWDNSYSSNYNKAGNVFIVNNFAYATGTISANTNSNIVVGLTITSTGSGTISGTFGDAVIYGYGTSFGTDVRVGRPIYRSDTSAEIGVVAGIESATKLSLVAPLTATISNVGFTAETSTTEFTSEIYVGDTLVVSPNIRLGTVKSINSDSNITLYTNALVTVSNVAFEHNARDTYSVPGRGDKYLKFPQVGVIT